MKFDEDIYRIQIHCFNGKVIQYNTVKSVQEIVKRVNEYEELEKENKKLKKELDGFEPISDEENEKILKAYGIQIENEKLSAQNRELVKSLKEVLEQFEFSYEMELEFDEKCKKETIEAYVRGKKKGIEIALSALEGICLRLGIDWNIEKAEGAE
jgi:sulfur relay (sulfurtransferase) DsrC/TusE family protein